MAAPWIDRRYLCLSFERLRIFGREAKKEVFFRDVLWPSIEIGQLWPPEDIVAFDPFNVPLLNTVILISSGLTVTWCHYRILNRDFYERIKSLCLAIILGVYFTTIRSMEYKNSPFAISDSVYGSIFLVATGFHGLRVLIGTLFLIVCFIRI